MLIHLTQHYGDVRFFAAVDAQKSIKPLDAISNEIQCKYPSCFAHIRSKLFFGLVSREVCTRSSLAGSSESGAMETTRLASLSNLGWSAYPASDRDRLRRRRDFHSLTTYPAPKPMVKMPASISSSNMETPPNVCHPGGKYKIRAGPMKEMAPYIKSG
jgi:hypothetical protein